MKSYWHVLTLWRSCFEFENDVCFICIQKNTILNMKLRIISVAVNKLGAQKAGENGLLRNAEGQQTPRYINKHCCEQSGSRPHGESRMEEPARWKLCTSGRCFTVHVYVQVCVCIVLYVSVRNTERCRGIQLSFGESCGGLGSHLVAVQHMSAWNLRTSRDACVFLPVSFIQTINQL